MAWSKLATTARGDLREVASAYIDRDAKEPFGVYAFGSKEPAANLARAVEGEVFLEAFGNTPEQLLEAYAPYEMRSFFICVMDHRRRIPAGSMRVIIPTPDEARCKTIDDLESNWEASAQRLRSSGGMPIPVTKAWDIATLAVSKEYRGGATNGLVALALYNAFVQPARILGVDWAVGIIDNVLLRFSYLHLCRPFEAFSGLEAQPYLGSEASTPVWCQLSAWSDRLHVGAPTLGESIFSGAGFVPALRPVDVASVITVTSDIYHQDSDYPQVIDLRDGHSMGSPVAVLDRDSG